MKNKENITAFVVVIVVTALFIILQNMDYNDCINLGMGC